MATRAGVSLEDNVAALVDRKTIVLVVDGAMQWSIQSSEQRRFGFGDGSYAPVLDCQIGGAAVEAVRVVTCRLAIAVSVRLITQSYPGPSQQLMCDRSK